MSENNKKKQFQSVGYFREGKAKASWKLELSIPFMPGMDFFVTEAEKKEESHPDFNCFYGGNKVGSLWKKKDKNGKTFYSGSVFCLFMPTGFLQISIFEEERQGEKVFVAKIPYEA